MHEDNFSLFDTQCFTPDVVPITEEEAVKGGSKVQKVLARLRPNVRTRSKKSSSTSEKGKANVFAIDDDDDDFVDDAPWKRKDQDVSKVVQARSVQGRSVDSSSDFVTQDALPAKKAPTVKKPGLSKNVPSKASKKSSTVVPELISQEFCHLSSARDIKNLILSNDFRRDYGK